jgi:hypothetical protein
MVVSSVNERWTTKRNFASSTLHEEQQPEPRGNRTLLPYAGTRSRSIPMDMVDHKTQPCHEESSSTVTVVPNSKSNVMLRGTRLAISIPSIKDTRIV